jgi:hypothetical protein
VIVGTLTFSFARCAVYRPAVDEELRRLDATVAASFGDSVDLDRARTADRQGIGGPHTRETVAAQSSSRGTT